MLHVGQNSSKCFSYKSRQSIAEGIFTPSYKLAFALGKKLHVGQNSCKCFSYKSKIGGRALQKGCLHQATNSQSERLVALGENSCKCLTSPGQVQCARQPAVYCAVQYSASVCSMVQCSFLFLNERTENCFIN